MGKAAMLYEGIEDLCVKEEMEEWPLYRGAVLQEQLLIEQVGDVPRALRGCGEERDKTLPIQRQNYNVLPSYNGGVHHLEVVMYIPIVSDYRCKEFQESLSYLHIHCFLKYHTPVT